MVVDSPYQEQSTLGCKNQDSSYPVTAQTRQLLLHGIVHEMDESGQRVFGAAPRAAENDRPSGSFQRQRGEAILTYGFFCHRVLLGFKPTGFSQPFTGSEVQGSEVLNFEPRTINAEPVKDSAFSHKLKAVGAIMQTCAFYAIWRRFARAVDAFP